MGFEILDTLKALKSLCCQDIIKLRIECENLETVYVEPVDDNRLLVHDHYHSINYLTTSGDKTYKDFDAIGLPFVRDLCKKHGVRLIDLDDCDDDPGWVIGEYANNDDQVRRLIKAIADCVDDLFSSVYRAP